MQRLFPIFSLLGTFMRTRKPARPAPRPIIPLAQRLESIRADYESELPSLRGFWQRVTEGWDDPPSYEAVRGWHYDREAPVSYLARVMEVFPGYMYPWLISGKGPRTQIEAMDEARSAEREKRFEDADKAVVEGFREHLPYDNLDEAGRAALWRAYQYVGGFFPLPEGLSAELDPHWNQEVAARISAAVAAPMRELRINPRNLLPFDLEGPVVMIAECIVRFIDAATEHRERDEAGGLAERWVETRGNPTTMSHEQERENDHA
jgi:hypothetical protein